MIIYKGVTVKIIFIRYVKIIIFLFELYKN